MMLLLGERTSGAVNVATGHQTTIRALAEAVKSASGFEGTISYDTSMPAGQPGRIFATDRIRATGWTPATDLESGLRRTVAWYEEHRDEARER